MLAFHDLEIETDTLTVQELHDISDLISRSHAVLARGISNIIDAPVAVHPLKAAIEPWDGHLDQCLIDLKEALPRETDSQFFINDLNCPHNMGEGKTAYIATEVPGPKTQRTLDYIKGQGEITKEVIPHIPDNAMLRGYLSPQEQKRLEKHQQEIENRHAEKNNLPAKKDLTDVPF